MADQHRNIPTCVAVRADMTPGGPAEFRPDWDDFDVTPADLAVDSPDFYEAVDLPAFDPPGNARAFRDLARELDADFLDESSYWLIAEEHVSVNGSPKVPLDIWCHSHHSVPLTARSVAA